MFKYKSFVIPLYSGSRNSSLKIVISDEKNWKKTLNLINSFNDEPETFFDYNNVAAFACMSGKKGVNHFWIVLTERGCNINTLSHEIIHAKNYVYISRHITLDAHNDEPEAYLTGWITEQCFNFARKYIK